MTLIDRIQEITPSLIRRLQDAGKYAKGMGNALPQAVKPIDVATASLSKDVNSGKPMTPLQVAGGVGNVAAQVALAPVRTIGNALNTAEEAKVTQKMRQLRKQGFDGSENELRSTAKKQVMVDAQLMGSIIGATEPIIPSVAPLNYNPSDIDGTGVTLKQAASTWAVRNKNIHQVNVPLNALSPQGGQWEAGSYPPISAGKADAIAVALGKDADEYVLNFIDGNHRAMQAITEGYDSIPAWFIDQTGFDLTTRQIGNVLTRMANGQAKIPVRLLTR